MKPWHDTTHCECGGPVVPFEDDCPHDVVNVRHVRCAACGKDWTEHDDAKLVQVWWSAGAYRGQEEAGE